MIEIDEGLRMDDTTLAQAESVAEVAASTAADVLKDTTAAMMRLTFKERVAKVGRAMVGRAMVGRAMFSAARPSPLPLLFSSHTHTHIHTLPHTPACSARARALSLSPFRLPAAISRLSLPFFLVLLWL